MPHRPLPAAKERSSPEPYSHRPLAPASATTGPDYEMGDMSGRDSEDEEMRLTADELGRGGGGPSHRWDEHGRFEPSSSSSSPSPVAMAGKEFFGLNLADAAVVRHLAVNALLIGLWYFFSLSISLYNQWMFSGDHLDFKFPLFTTCMHMLVQFALASLVLYFFPRFRPQNSFATSDASSSSQQIESQHQQQQQRRPLMSRWYYISRIGPCGAATGLDIGLGNMSMRFITLTFYTMCKSSVLGFVLLFAFLFRLERPSVKLLAIIAVMTVGVVLMVAGETAFDLQGFLLIMSAAAFSGFRWALTQILLLRNPATGNPFSSLFFLAPVMFATLLVIAVPVETVSAVLDGLRDLTAQQGTLRGVVLLLFPGTLAFCMVSSEFALLKRTSVVTLSVCGIFKEVVTIVAAQNTLDHDRMTVVNVAGLLITIASIATYNYIKIKKMRADAEDELRKSHGGVAGPFDAQGGDGGDNGNILASEEERPMLADQENGVTESDSYDAAPVSPSKRLRDIE